MNSFYFKKLSWIGTVAGILVLAACTKSDKLTPLDSIVIANSVPNSVQVNFCTDETYVPKQYVKMLIILDHSGSNKLNYKMDPNGTGAPDTTGGQLTVNSSYATDPTGAIRYGNVNSPGTLLNYLSTIPANDPKNPTHFFALIDFNDVVSTYPTSGTGFTSDTVDFYNYVAKDATSGGNSSPTDGGATDYIGALKAAQDMIQGDLDSAKTCAALPVGSASPGSWCPNPGVAVASSYVIVFMSDGAPITEINGVEVFGNLYKVNGDFSYVIEPQVTILSEIASLTALVQQNPKFVTSVNLFTIYYYALSNIDKAGRSLLINMAQAGNGLFYDATAGSTIDYTRFQPLAKQMKFTLADVFVTNSSVTWWKDGQLHADSDMDGLPDDIEKAWGSDPNKYSTQNNGVSDLVRYMATNGAPCMKKGANGICQDAAVNYANTTCSGIKTTRLNGLFSFVASDPNGLNDCEKTILNDVAGINNPDSNNDLLPDWLEFLAGIPFQNGTAPGVNIPQQDGYSIYQKVKFSLPQNVSLNGSIGLTPSSYQLNLVSSNDKQDCYQLSVMNLPAIGSTNTVRVDIIEKSTLSDLIYLYKVGKKAFSSNSPNLNFNDWNDPNEIQAKTWQVWP